MDNPFKSPAVLSVCTGINGIERGLARAIGNIRVVAYVEIEAFIAANLVAAMEAGILAPTPIWTDLKTFPGSLFRNRIHGIIGGYPCQPFSNAGERRGTEDPRHLFPYIERIIRDTRPAWAFFENVRGHLNLGFKEVSESLRTMGYAVESGIFTAEEVGAPHLRSRLFILAIDMGYAKSERLQSGIHQFRIATSQPEPTHTSSSPMADPNNRWESQQPREFSESGDRSVNSSEELANTNSTTTERISGGVLGETRIDERTAQGEDREWNRNVTSNSSNVQSLADCIGQGLEVPREQSAREECSPAERGGSPILKPDRWPAYPGQEQYRWEHPRTVESGMGSTVNGYDFREDFLRALGNSVVEQTAEVAFQELYKRFTKKMAK